MLDGVSEAELLLRYGLGKYILKARELVKLINKNEI